MKGGPVCLLFVSFDHRERTYSSEDGFPQTFGCLRGPPPSRGSVTVFLSKRCKSRACTVGTSVFVRPWLVEFVFSWCCVVVFLLL